MKGKESGYIYGRYYTQKLERADYSYASTHRDKAIFAGFSFIVRFPDFHGVRYEPSRTFVAREAVDHFRHFRLHCLDGWVEVVDDGVLNRLFEARRRAVDLSGPCSEVLEVQISGFLGLIELFVLLPPLGPSLEFVGVDIALSHLLFSL